VTTGNEFGRVQALYVQGETLYVRTGTRDGPFDRESYTLSETPIGLFATEIDGTVIIVDDDTVSMGKLSSDERMQWWLQGSAFLLALGLVILIMKKPKWWLIDLAGILMGAGVVALMGISFPLLFTMLLLVLLAGYDAVAVYKTKHMIALADSVVEAKMPILLVFPMRLDYRYEDETNLMDPKRKRRSLFMGLGDVIIPGILIVSAYSFLPAYGGTWLFGFVPPNLGVALFTLSGMLMGYAILIGFVLKGKAHAGLPPLNGGSILMFLLGHLLLYGTIVFW
jgi:presenilin-like A22 family membrane protease